MDNMPQMSKEPELIQISMAYEDNLNKAELLTHEIKGKIKSIYNPPQLEPSPKLTFPSEPKDRPQDFVSEVQMKNQRLQDCVERLEEILMAINRII